MIKWLERIKEWLLVRPRKDMIRILAVMPKTADRGALTRIAAKEHWWLEFTHSREAALKLIRRERFPIVVCDRDLTTQSDWREAIHSLAESAPGTCVILASPFNDDQLWQEVISCGGYDVLTKPFQEERVVRSVQSACASGQRS